MRIRRYISASREKVAAIAGKPVTGPARVIYGVCVCVCVCARARVCIRACVCVQAQCRRGLERHSQAYSRVRSDCARDDRAGDRADSIVTRECESVGAGTVPGKTYTGARSFVSESAARIGCIAAIVPAVRKMRGEQPDETKSRNRAETSGDKRRAAI